MRCGSWNPRGSRLALQGSHLTMRGVVGAPESISWQITPRVLTEAFNAGGPEAKRAFDAMMEMKKIDVAKIEKARRG